MTRSAIPALMLMLVLGGCGSRSHAEPPPPVTEKVIPLPDTRGRIDHLALDLTHKRLFIAELGNGTVDVVDLDAGRVTGRIKGLQEPQGLAYLPDTNELAASTGGDGTVRFYDAATLAQTAVLTGLPDADNIRVSPANGDIIVGYGGGALAVIDAKTHRVKSTLPLPSHPEGFQIAPDGLSAVVNLPRSMSIAVVDLKSGKQTASWPARKAFENFPLAADWPSRTVAVGFRLPGRFMTFDATGNVTANVPACGPADDLFFDGRRQRFYMLCGDGHVDVFSRSGTGWSRNARIDTAPGGRTGLFSAELDRLFVVSGGDAATVRVLRPE